MGQSQSHTPHRIDRKAIQHQIHQRRGRKAAQCRRPAESHRVKALSSSSKRRGSMNLLADLGWLRRAPADLGERCRSIAGNPKQPDMASDTALLDVANYALDINQLTRVSKLVADPSEKS